MGQIRPPLYHNLPIQNAIHEKSKTAAVHCVRWVKSIAGTHLILNRLGEEVSKRGSLTRDVGLDETPFATFIFKYRPLGMPAFPFPLHLLSEASRRSTG